MRLSWPMRNLGMTWRCLFLGHSWIRLPGLFRTGNRMAQAALGLAPPMRALDVAKMAAEPDAVRICRRCKTTEIPDLETQ